MRPTIDWKSLDTLGQHPMPVDETWKQIKCRKGPKKHSVNRERSFIARINHKRAQHLIKQKLESLHAYKAEVRQYWLGEIDEHPSKPTL